MAARSRRFAPGRKLAPPRPTRPRDRAPPGLGRGFAPLRSPAPCKFVPPRRRPFQTRAASAPLVLNPRRFGGAGRAASQHPPRPPRPQLRAQVPSRPLHVPCTSLHVPCMSHSRPIRAVFMSPSLTPHVPSRPLRVSCTILDLSHLIQVISSESSHPVRYIRVIYSQPPSESLGSGGRHTSAPLVIEKVPFRCHSRVTRLIAVPVTT